MTRVTGAGSARRGRRQIRVFLADGQGLLRDGLRALLDAEPDMRVAGDTDDGHALVSMLRRQPVDLLLLDPRLSGPDLSDQLGSLRQTCPTVRILVLGWEAEDRLAVQCVHAGAGGFIARDNPAELVLAAIRKVMAGEIALSPALTRELAFSMLLTEEVPEPHALLSVREELVFRRLVGGASVSGIAAELGLSVKTVSTYKTRLQSKLDCDGLAGLVRYAARHRLYRDPSPSVNRWPEDEADGKDALPPEDQ